MKPKALLDYAALWLKKRNLDVKIAKLREQQRALLMGHCGFTSSFGEDGNRGDLTLDIPLAAYLALFPDSEKESTLKEYETDYQFGDANSPRVPVVARYLRWPVKHCGSIPLDKSKPLHVWVQAYSQTTYTPKAEATPAAMVQILAETPIPREVTP